MSKKHLAESTLVDVCGTLICLYSGQKGNINFHYVVCTYILTDGWGHLKHGILFATVE